MVVMVCENNWNIKALNLADNNLLNIFDEQDMRKADFEIFHFQPKTFWTFSN